MAIKQIKYSNKEYIEMRLSQFINTTHKGIPYFKLGRRHWDNLVSYYGYPVCISVLESYLGIVITDEVIYNLINKGE